MIVKSLLLVLLIISFQGCATWMGLKQDSKQVWGATKDTSKEVYETVTKTRHE